MFTRLASLGALFYCLAATGCGGKGDAEEPVTGPQGEPGPPGPAGAAGASCSVLQIDDDTAVIVCPDGTTATLKSKSCGGKK